MRSIFGRAAIPFVTLSLFASITSSAHASETNTITRGGAPWILLGGTYAGAKTTDVEARGRSIIASHVKVVASALVTSGVDRFGDGETIVRYAQLHHGLPVIGRGASVRLSASGEPIATVLDLERDLPSRASTTLTSTEAAKVASTGTAFGASAGDAHLVVWPTLDRGARLAYAVLPRVPAGIPSRPRVIVDAETGEVLEARDLVTFVKASMFPLNPTKTPTPKLTDFAIAPVGKTLSNPFLESSNCIDKKTVKDLDFGFAMKVHVCDLEQVATANTSGEFVYEPSDEEGSAAAAEDPFSEVSIYFHAAKAYAWFRALQGDTEAQVVDDKPLRVVANLRMPAGMMTGNMQKAADPNLALEPFQNAFFSPASGGLGAVFQQLYGFDSGALWFGQGPKRDYAYDGDVVYHEFGHAVVDATIKLEAWHVDARGAIDSPGAMNEGLADYFSSAIAGDPDVGEYASIDMGAAPGTAIRTLANQDKCPTAVAGEVHFDSTLFSGALWQARMQLPEADRSTFDAALYKAMRTNPGRGDLGYDDLAKLFLATLKTDFPAGEAALEKAMTDRGVLPACERILTFESAPITSPYEHFGFAAPGKQSVSVKGTSPGIIQVRAALPPNTASVTVTFNARSGGGQGSFGGNAKPFAPVVLAKLGAPITWAPASKTGHDADLKAAAEGTREKSATIEIPEGTTADTIYLQIANTGDSDGAYDQIALAFTAKEGAVTPDPAGVPTPAATPAADSGCTASAYKTRASTTVLPAILAAAAALTAVRRRRRSTER